VVQETSQAGQTTAFLRSIRAVRRFSSQAISDAVLKDILEVARWTGSSKNTQPWHLIVVRDKSTLAQLADCGPYAGHLAGAQAAIVLVMDDGNKRFDEGRLAQTISLAAWACGVGSCIGSIYPDGNKERARKLLGVPPKKWLHTAISLGYPADENALRLSANRAGLTDVPIGRTRLADLVSWERMSSEN
jgi:nitroreductase